jgi:hypothetical protein
MRPYQLLRNFVGSPQMPTGYAGMIVLSFFPPLFKHIMDKRISDLNSKQITKGEDFQTLAILVGLALVPNMLFFL